MCKNVLFFADFHNPNQGSSHGNMRLDGTMCCHNIWTPTNSTDLEIKIRATLSFKNITSAPGTNRRSSSQLCQQIDGAYGHTDQSTDRCTDRWHMKIYSFYFYLGTVKNESNTLQFPNLHNKKSNRRLCFEIESKNIFQLF